MNSKSPTMPGSSSVQLVSNYERLLSLGRTHPSFACPGLGPRGGRHCFLELCAIKTRKLASHATTLCNGVSRAIAFA